MALARLDLVCYYLLQTFPSLHCALNCAVYCNRPCLCGCLWVCYQNNLKLHASILIKLGLKVKVVTISS